jgi:hypothetical protein
MNIEIPSDDGMFDPGTGVAFAGRKEVTRLLQTCDNSTMRLLHAEAVESIEAASRLGTVQSIKHWKS